VVNVESDGVHGEMSFLVKPSFPTGFLTMIEVELTESGWSLAEEDNSMPTFH
jgi:hypothetical protein